MSKPGLGKIYVILLVVWAALTLLSYFQIIPIGFLVFSFLIRYIGAGIFAGTGFPIFEEGTGSFLPGLTYLGLAFGIISNLVFLLVVAFIISEIINKFQLTRVVPDQKVIDTKPKYSIIKWTSFIIIIILIASVAIVSYTNSYNKNLNKNDHNCERDYYYNYSLEQCVKQPNSEY